MRYDNWDVILFPRDSHIPIQEFRTSCYVAQNEYGHQLPTLTCFIASLPAAAPFRISLHSWAIKARPSALIESRRKAGQRVVYTLQVIVDGARVFHDFYDVSSNWPQEIVHEKRSIGYPELTTSQRKPCLGFPPFHRDILMRNAWHVRDNNGRIKVLLSEQLIERGNELQRPGEIDFGAVNDLVCFAFQHAPRDILEQTGISWPIRNPLYLPSSDDSRSAGSSLQSSYEHSRKHATEARAQSPIAKPSDTSHARPHNPEPYARRRTDAPPQYGRFPRPPGGGGRGRVGVWEDSSNEFTGDSFEDVSMMDSWSTRRTSSNSITDVSMPDFMFVSPVAAKPRNNWNSSTTHFDQGSNNKWAEIRPRKERERQVVVALRDDQLGQLVEAISPPKKARDGEGSGQRSERQHPYPSKMRPPGVPTTRQSAAALARTASYPDFNVETRNTLAKQSPEKYAATELRKSSSVYHSSYSSNKENHPPTSKENRVPTPFPFFDHTLARGSFVPNCSSITSWDPDVSTRGSSWTHDPSSVVSSLSRSGRPHQMMASKVSPAHTPAAGGDVKSRKEGLGTNSPATAEQATRHDQSLLPTFDSNTTARKEKEKAPHNTPASATLGTSPQVEDVTTPSGTDASTFVPGHKAGLSSMDSTGRLERQLFSALGEELNSNFNDTVDLTLAERVNLPDLEDMDGLAGKRKRQGTFGSDRGRSPMAKMVREEKEDVEGTDTGTRRLRSD
ncbi:hypothetical protein BDV95DRAFT_499738 [Massariosphaeria phaeospora]|uniref:Uncharacterized protein n=1 Tax=Massariosphaeria phaeospora TaxID=100035 RepID=A0A7C8I5I6_9PLEO|nr:hypothetical protein BDV95DRAFT_499738 [Massariosphaeria phaeospora]